MKHGTLKHGKNEAKREDTPKNNRTRLQVKEEYSWQNLLNLAETTYPRHFWDFCTFKGFEGLENGLL